MARQRFRSSSCNSQTEILNTRNQEQINTSLQIRELFKVWMNIDGKQGKSFLHHRLNCPFSNDMIGLVHKIFQLASLLDRDSDSHDGIKKKSSMSLFERLILAQEKESGYTPLHKAMIDKDLIFILKILRLSVIDLHDQQLMYENNANGRLSYSPMNMLEGEIGNQTLLKLIHTKDYEGFTPLDLLCQLQRTDLARCRKYLRDKNSKSFEFSESSVDDEYGLHSNDDDDTNALHDTGIHQDSSLRLHSKDNTISSNEYGYEVFTFGRANHYALGVIRSSDSSLSDHQNKNPLTPEKGIYGPIKNCTFPRIQRVKSFGLADLGPAKSATAIAAASHHTLVATQNGELFSFGLGKGGRLGTGDERHQPLPVRVMGPLTRQFVVSIAAAENHSLCVTSEGNVYGWGSNRFGQLGLMSKRSLTQIDNKKKNLIGNQQHQRFVPRKIDCLKHVFCVSVAAGDRHSVALSRKGEVFCWGDNQVGQLGTSIRAGIGVEGNTSKNYSSSSFGSGIHQATRVNALWEATPKRIAFSISASEMSTMVLTHPPKLENAYSKNTIYSWGHGNHIPIKVNFAPSQDKGTITMSHINPVAIACARYHNVAIMADGCVYTWGLHKDPLGLSSASEKKMKEHTPAHSMIIASPQLVTEMLPENGGGIAVAVSASDNHTAVLTDCGRLYTWGFNDCKNAMGHVGVRWQPIPKQVHGVFRAVKVAVAKEHTVLLVGTTYPKAKKHDEKLHETLNQKASRAVAHHVDLFNVIPILITAERICCSFLIDYCIEFIKCNLDGVLAVGRKSEMNCYLNEKLSDGLHCLTNLQRDECYHPLIVDILDAIHENTIGGLTLKSESIKHRVGLILNNASLFIKSKISGTFSKKEQLSSSIRDASEVLNNPDKAKSRSRKNSCSSITIGKKDDAQENARKCSERCIAMTSNMKFDSKEDAENKLTSLSKEIRAIKKRLNQIEKLENASHDPVKVLTNDQIEKVQKRSLFEADLAMIVKFYEEVELIIKTFKCKGRDKGATNSLEDIGEMEVNRKESKLIKDDNEIACQTSGDDVLQKNEHRKKQVDLDNLTSSHYRCFVCNITCPDESSFTLHNSGRKHTNRVKQFEELEKKNMAETLMKEKKKLLLMKGQCVSSAPRKHQNPWKKSESQGIESKYKLKPPQKKQIEQPVKSDQIMTLQQHYHSVFSRSEDIRVGKSFTSSKLRAVGKRVNDDVFPILNSQKQMTLQSKQSQIAVKPCTSNKIPNHLQKKHSQHGVSHTSENHGKAEIKRSLWLGDFVVDDVRPKTNQISWKLPSNLKKNSEVKTSLLQIQDEEEDLKSRQDRSCSFDGSWYVERRERAGSISKIQDEEKKKKEFTLLVEEQKQIEEQIKNEIKKKSKLEKKRNLKNKKNSGKKKNVSKSTKTGHKKNNQCQTLPHKANNEKLERLS